MLCGKNESLEVANNEICSSLMENPETTEAELTADMDSTDVYKKRFVDLKLRHHSLQQSEGTTSQEEEGADAGDQVSVVGSNVSNQAGRRKFKLPIIELTKFDGNIREWLPFWGQFSKIDSDSDIDNNDKVLYLIQSTVPGSRARQLVESFPAIGENYEKVVNALKSRFGRDDLQIEVYVREMLGLIINNAVSKSKMDLSSLYDRIETQLRALETLGVASDKCSAMLFPLIESCLPSELLRVWQRSQANLPANPSMETRLESLMQFLRGEVENEQRIILATQGLGLSSASGKDSSNAKNSKSSETRLPTAAGLMNCDVTKCIFCDGAHASESCFKAQKFSIDQKKTVCKEKKVCFRCLKFGHLSTRCRSRLRCIVCGRAHLTLCSNGSVNPDRDDKKAKDTAEQTLTNNGNCLVFLQTLRVTARSENGSCEIRALIDTGSQRSYLLKSTITQLGYTAKREELVAHGLFGGVVTQVPHKCYDIRLRHENYACKFEVLDQQVICTSVPAIGCGPWITELEELNIEIHGTQDSSPIELLIGADVVGRLYTGKRRVLKCGLVAIETLLGWTLLGKVYDVEAAKDKSCSSLAATSLSLLLNDTYLTNLWELDTLGITEPSERKSREERAAAAIHFFKETVTLNAEGRYEVRLPWIEGHRPLPSNRKIAERRLQSTLKKLKKDNLVESYGAVFQEWLSEGIIEPIHIDSGVSENGHYLPHRPVIKEDSTTKIRPVFDASAREIDSPSLNHCLEKDKTSLLRFIQEATEAMREANFELRGWEFSDENNDETAMVPLLGLNWYLARDVIKISDGCLRSSSKFDEMVISKRLILSMAQKVFDHWLHLSYNLGAEITTSEVMGEEIDLG
ncbi:uncharacterized protein LOC115875798 [Sitophilus oryzae]|uniref:Uncharacterized protein LOC115875798 n=1 Tax=Sitophilus oryzae TaxID=7048 RepID=A0A6J2X7F2_SITOR|nr:uncharacterized protein LOC115875798 [Sitophilus oryzae]